MIVCGWLETGRMGRSWRASESVKDGLAAFDARFVLYAELLYNACQVYGDYLAETQTVDRLRGVIKEIDDFAPASA